MVEPFLECREVRVSQGFGGAATGDASQILEEVRGAGRRLVTIDRRVIAHCGRYSIAASVHSRSGGHGGDPRDHEV
jgi:hypothetical protein